MVNDIFCLWLINKNCISCLWLGFPATVQWTSTPLEQMNQALDIRCFDWQIWQANDNTPALWLLFKYISKAEITACISFLMAFTLTVGTEWIPLVGWRLKDTSMRQRCNFLPFLIPSHLCMAQFKLSERSSKFRIQSLSHFSEISFRSPSYYLVGLRSFVPSKFSVHGLLVWWVCFALRLYWDLENGF